MKRATQVDPQEKRVLHLPPELKALIERESVPEGENRMHTGHLTTQTRDKKVEAMIAEFLGLLPDLRREYIETLSDLLCTRKRLYPNRRSGYPPEPYASNGPTPAFGVQ